MDIHTLACKIVQQSIGEEPKKKPTGEMENRGIARAKSITALERKDIAMKAAQICWKNRSGARADPLAYQGISQTSKNYVRIDNRLHNLVSSPVFLLSLTLPSPDNPHSLALHARKTSPAWEYSTSRPQQNAAVNPDSR